MVKNIAIMDQVYAYLVKHKRPGESFSKEIQRMLPNVKNSILEAAGTWNISEAESEDIKRSIKEKRMKTTQKVQERIS